MSAGGRYFDCVAQRYALQLAEEPIAMPSDPDIPVPAEHCRTANSSQAAVQRKAIGTFKNWRNEVKTGNGQDTKRAIHLERQTSLVCIDSLHGPEAQVWTSSLGNRIRLRLLQARLFRRLAKAQSATRGETRESSLAMM